MRPTIGPIRAFLYARSASESQNAPTAKADEQLQRLRKHAQERSYVVVCEASDAAHSGNSLSRPGLALVMSQATRTPPAFDVLLTTNSSRLARDARLLMATVSRLIGAGVQIESIGELWGEAEQTALQKLSDFLDGRRHEED
jgi:DNA invertase Pin-like site-specific DNA recombinase